MKINTKILLLIGISLVTCSLIISVLAVWQIDRSAKATIQQIEKLGESNLERVRNEGARQKEDFRARLLADKKEYLKSQVQTAIGVISKSYADASDPDKLKLVYREQLQNAVNTAYGVMVSVEQEAGLSLEEKQAKAAKLIQDLRYGPENKDYFWINDMNPTMVMHPYKPQLNGKDLTQNKDPNGKHLFVEFVKTCRDNGEGFVDYHWPKYGADTPQPKLSFVKLFKPWNWVIGSGVYVEMAEEKLQADSAKMIEALRYGPDNADYFWINDMNPTMVMHPYKPQLNGKDLSQNKDPNGKHLFVEFVKTCRENGEGFVDYHWPKYGASEPQPKLSFVKLFRPWNWIIGTGLYIDDIEAIVADKEKELAQNIEQTSQDILAKVRQVQEQTLQSRTRVLQMILGGTVFLILVILGISLYLARRNISNPIQSISDVLGDNNVRIGVAADQISSLSQELSGAASSQAASIEETSSSMEELSAMTKQNAENARQADNLMKAAMEVVQKAEQSMKELTASMDEISDSGQQSSKIIKTIDEIAFQTNLLALNAAVEAARAGDAGAGFAVVADEVRSLALRAAEAAKNTADLIEKSVQKTSKGSDLLSQTDAAFAEVAVSASKVEELLAEISIGSSEQADGIEQVNRAVAEMDKITQQNAATAEESAGSSVELQGEAAKMKTAVEKLIQLISGSRNGKNGNGKHDNHVPDMHPSRSKTLDHRKGKELFPAGGELVSPDKVIPMDGEFKDFDDEWWDENEGTA